MGIFGWVIAGLLLCILFAILRLTDHIKQESWWIKDHVNMLIKEMKDVNESLGYRVEDKISGIARNTDRIQIIQADVEFIRKECR